MSTKTKRNSNQTAERHAPQRTCVACRKVKAKQELIRLVRVADSCVEVDEKGRKAGRGAYLCRAPECWDLGLKGGRLEHTLRIRLTQDNREHLIKFGIEFVNNGEQELSTPSP